MQSSWFPWVVDVSKIETECEEDHWNDYQRVKDTWYRITQLYAIVLSDIRFIFIIIIFYLRISTV